jgi:hypothetical protein
VTTVIAPHISAAIADIHNEHAGHHPDLDQILTALNALIHQPDTASNNSTAATILGVALQAIGLTAEALADRTAVLNLPTDQRQPARANLLTLANDVGELARKDHAGEAAWHIDPA